MSCGLLAAMAFFLTAVAGEVAIDAGERVPAVMLVITPRGAEPSTRTAEMLRAAAEVLEPKTDLVLRSPEQTGSDLDAISECGRAKDRLSCWVRAVRRDYDRLALELGNGEVLPYDEHEERVRSRGLSYPRFLLVVASFPREGEPDRLTTMLIDTDQALRAYHEAPRRQGWQEVVENRVFETAVQGKPGFAGVSNARELHDYFEKVLEDTLRPALERAGHWMPHGAIQLASAGGLVIELDGRVVGTTREGTTDLAEVAPGRRTIVLTHPDGAFEPFSVDVSLRRGETARVEAVLRPGRSRTATLGRQAVLWSGIGVAAIGAGLAVYGAIAEPGVDYYGVCAAGSCEAAERSTFVTFCDLGAERSGECSPGQGVLVAPLGYSLVATGGIWSLGAWLFSDDSSVPWIPIAAGIAAGALSYGLSAAFGG